ncbi:MAG: response regulator [Elusimicrobia bacterium]|nr:response regulator [Elusimicrobiota bacterium]
MSWNGRAFSIQTRLMAGVLPLAVGIPLLVIGVAYLRFSKFTASTLDNGLTGLAGKLAGDMDDELGQRVNDLMTLSQNPLFVDYHNNKEYQLLQEAAVNRDTLESFFSAFAQRAQVYPVVEYVSEEGRPVILIIRGRPYRQDQPTQNSLSLFGRAAGAEFKKIFSLKEGEYFVSSVIKEAMEDFSLIYFAKPVRGPGGENLGVLALGYDVAIMEKKMAEAKISGQESAYIEDDRGRVIAGNKSFFSQTFSRSVALAKRPWKIYLTIEPAYFLKPLRDIRNLAVIFGIFVGLAAIFFVFWVVRSTTRPIRVLVDGTRELARGNLDHRVSIHEPRELAHLSTAFNEMASQLKNRELQQRQLQDHLMQSEKLSAVGQLISGIAHELNNPLNGITGYAELMLEEECPQSLRRDLEQIRAHALRCRRIIDNLLLFVRQGSREKKAVDINKVIRSVLTLLEYRLTKADNVEVNFVPEKLPPVQGDFQQLEQVLVNLIQNAYDALVEPRAERPKIINVQARHESGKVYVRVQDNGPGVPPEHREKIFEPFFTTKEAGRGTGLGLAIAWQIVKEHAGGIACQSQAGQGTIFTVDLPALLAARRDEEPQTVSVTEPSGQQILVVDDERDLARMTARLVRKMGYDADVVYDVASAQKKIAKKTYDFVLLDLAMPGESGYDFYQLLVKENPSFLPRLIFITGDVLNPDCLEFLKNNRIVYLTKPFSGEELRLTLAKTGLGARSDHS